jgi:hypothetical protein
MYRSDSTKIDFSGEVSVNFQPSFQEINFQLQADTIVVSMSLPGWNTQASFVTERTRDFGYFGHLHVDGSYLIYTVTHPDHVETLSIAIDVHPKTCSLFFLLATADELSDRRHPTP